jgi:hypothetical protein
MQLLVAGAVLVILLVLRLCWAARSWTRRNQEMKDGRLWKRP